MKAIKTQARSTQRGSSFLIILLLNTFYLGCESDPPDTTMSEITAGETTAGETTAGETTAGEITCDEEVRCEMGELVDEDCTAVTEGVCVTITVCGQTYYCFEASDDPQEECQSGYLPNAQGECVLEEALQEEVNRIWSSIRSEIDASSPSELVVMFGDENGVQFVHEKGASQDQVFPIASASKLLSALLIMKLVEDGLMSLDDHPQQYLDWWTDDPSDLRSSVTLAQLLSFTSGFEGGTGLGGQDGIECVEDRNTTLDSCVREIYDRYFTYDPGTTYFYGPAHLHIAARMAEVATGETWVGLFRRLIYVPLGLEGMTTYTLPSINNPRASGGAIASAANYAKILTSIVAGTLLSSESLNTLTQDRTPQGVTLAYVPTTADGWHYAFGCWRECLEEEYTSSCDEPGVISSPGAFGFYPWFDQSTGYWGLIATQIRIRGSSVTVPLGREWYRQARQALDVINP